MNPLPPLPCHFNHRARILGSLVAGLLFAGAACSADYQLEDSYGVPTQWDHCATLENDLCTNDWNAEYLAFDPSRLQHSTITKHTFSSLTNAYAQQLMGTGSSCNWDGDDRTLQPFCGWTPSYDPVNDWKDPATNWLGFDFSDAARFSRDFDAADFDEDIDASHFIARYETTIELAEGTHYYVNSQSTGGVRIWIKPESDEAVLFLDNWAPDQTSRTGYYKTPETGDYKIIVHYLRSGDAGNLDVQFAEGSSRPPSKGPNKPLTYSCNESQWQLKYYNHGDDKPVGYSCVVEPALSQLISFREGGEKPASVGDEFHALWSTSKYLNDVPHAITLGSGHGSTTLSSVNYYLQRTSGAMDPEEARTTLVQASAGYESTEIFEWFNAAIDYRTKFFELNDGGNGTNDLRLHYDGTHGEQEYFFKLDFCEGNVNKAPSCCETSCE
jgi:hypothetical protein